MAEDDLDDEVDVEAEAAAEVAEAEQSTARARRMGLVFAVAALLVGLVGGGAGGYVVASTLAAPAGHGEAAAAEAPAKQTPAIYVDLPKVHTNIASARCRGLYINLAVTAAVDSTEEAAALRAASAMIQDGLTEHARSVTKEDLEGREGSERLRANVEAIVNNAIGPARVRDILFKEFVLQ